MVMVEFRKPVLIRVIIAVAALVMLMLIGVYFYMQGSLQD